MVTRGGIILTLTTTMNMAHIVRYLLHEHVSMMKLPFISKHSCASQTVQPHRAAMAVDF